MEQLKEYEKILEQKIEEKGSKDKEVITLQKYIGMQYQSYEDYETALKYFLDVYDAIDKA